MPMEESSPTLTWIRTIPKLRFPDGTLVFQMQRLSLVYGKGRAFIRERIEKQLR